MNICEKYCEKYEEVYGPSPTTTTTKISSDTFERKMRGQSEQDPLNMQWESPHFSKSDKKLEQDRYQSILHEEELILHSMSLHVSLPCSICTHALLPQKSIILTPMVKWIPNIGRERARSLGSEILAVNPLSCHPTEHYYHFIIWLNAAGALYSNIPNLSFTSE